MDYKKYSLEQLENWMHDAMSCGDATPQEIYDVIIEVVKDNYYTYKKQASEAYELLSLLNGNGDWTVEEVLKEKEYYEPSMPPWGHSDLEYLVSQNTNKDTELVEKSGGYDWTPIGPKDGYPVYMNQNGDVCVPDYVTKEDKVKRWVLPTQVDGLTGDVIVNLPDDLLERAGLKEGDVVEWIDRKDGSFEMRKANGPE
jgi:hypothetical protein